MGVCSSPDKGALLEESEGEKQEEADGSWEAVNIHFSKTGLFTLVDGLLGGTQAQAVQRPVVLSWRPLSNTGSRQLKGSVVA